MCKKFTLTCILIIIIMSLLSRISHASWARALTAEELFARSDLIVAGKIKGEAGEFKDERYCKTNWHVEVEYVFKGTPKSSELVVTTPGAAGADIRTGHDYALDDVGGDYALLFLQKKNDRLEPLQPNGVIALEPTGETVSPVKSGEDFIRIYQCANENPSLDNESLIERLNETNVSTPPKVSWWKRILEFVKKLFL